MSHHVQSDLLGRDADRWALARVRAVVQTKLVAAVEHGAVPN